MTTGRNYLKAKDVALELGQSVEWFRTHRRSLTGEFYMPEPARTMRPMKWLAKPMRAWIAGYMAGSTPEQLKEIVERATRAAVNDNAQLSVFDTDTKRDVADTAISEAQERLRQKLKGTDG